MNRRTAILVMGEEDWPGNGEIPAIYSKTPSHRDEILPSRPAPPIQKDETDFEYYMQFLQMHTPLLGIKTVPGKLR